MVEFEDCKPNQMNQSKIPQFKSSIKIKDKKIERISCLSSRHNALKITSKSHLRAVKQPKQKYNSDHTHKYSSKIYGFSVSTKNQN